MNHTAISTSFNFMTTQLCQEKTIPKREPTRRKSDSTDLGNDTYCTH